MTEEEKKAEKRRKAREYYYKQKAEREEHWRQRDAAAEAERIDRERALAECRRIRDSDTASDGDKLKAIQILMKLGMDAPQEIPEKDDLPF